MKREFIPLCMSAAEHAYWQEQAQYIRSQWPGRRPPKTVCADCTVSFARSMREQRRCNGKTAAGEDIIDRVRELVPLGLSSGQMSARLGVDAEYIRRVRRKHGI